MYDNILNSKKLLFVPAIMAFMIALLLCFKFSYPISWDVYYHIHMANLYMTNGIVFWDYNTVAPTGRLIMYPPLFHWMLASISNLTAIPVVFVCKYLQPLFAFFMVFVISFVSYRFSDDVLTGFFGGLLSLLCFVTINRAFICTPATIAIALSLLCCLYFYEAFDEADYKKVIISSICLALIMNLHMATAIIVIGVLGLYSFLLLFRRRLSIKLLLTFMLIFVLLGLPWWIYVHIKYGLFFNSLPGSALRFDEYILKYYGIIPSIFTFIGYYVLYKRGDEKSFFLFVWTLSILLLSQVYILGIQTVSIRILEVASYPLVIVAAFGFKYVYDCIKKNKIKVLLVILLIMLSALSSLMYVDTYMPNVLADEDTDTNIFPLWMHEIIDPVGSIIKPSIISDRWADAELARNRYDIMTYFSSLNDSGLLVSEDAVMDTIIVSSSTSNVVYGGFTESIPDYVVDPVHIVHNNSTSAELRDLNINYILLKNNTPIPSYAYEVYNNTNYRVSKVIHNQSEFS